MIDRAILWVRARIFEPVVGIIGGNITAKEVTQNNFDFNLVFTQQNINYLIIGTIGAFIFGIAAYMARLLCERVFKK